MTTLLLLGLAGALSAENFQWDTSDGHALSGTADLVMSDSDGDTNDDYHFYYKNSSDMWQELSNSPKSDSSSSGTTSISWDTTGGQGDLNGDYELNVTNGTAGSNIWSDTITVTVDNTAPSASSFSPSDGGYTNDDSDTASYSASDDHTNITYENLTIEDSDGNFVAGEEDTSIDLDNEDDDTYTASYNVRDFFGHWTNSSWDFTVDTSYDASSDPSFDPEPGVILLEEDEDKDIDITIDENDEDTEITATCYDEGDDSIDSETNDVDADGETTFTCEIDGDDYSNTEEDIYVEFCDTADNCQESDTETFTFDGSSPSLTDVDTDVTTVNSNFTVEYSASDVSGIEELEYFYDDEDVDVGDGNSVEVDGDDEEFTASVEDIDKGEHTLYVRVKDGADRWSSTESLDIEYLPDASPEVSLTVPDNVTVSAGESTSFDVTVQNTGKIYISEVDVSASVSDVFSENQSTSDLMPDDTWTLSYTVDTEPGDLGEYTATVSSGNPEASSDFTFIVEANSTQEENLEQELQDWNQTLKSLRQNVTRLKNSGLSDSRASRLDSNFSEFEQKVEDAREAYSNGEYYRVSSVLEGIDTEYQSAKTSYTTVEAEHSKAKQTQLIMMAIGLFLIILAGTGVFFWQSDEYDFHIDRLADSDLDIQGLEDVPNRIRSIFKNEDEAEEFEWDGFR